MRELNFTVRGTSLIPSSSLLGRVGEDRAATCRFNVSEWATRWPAALYNVIVVQSNNIPYIVAAAATAASGWITLELPSACLKISGSVYVEVRAISEGRVSISGKTPRMTILLIRPDRIAESDMAADTLAFHGGMYLNAEAVHIPYRFPLEI